MLAAYFMQKKLICERTQSFKVILDTLDLVYCPMVIRRIESLVSEDYVSLYNQQFLKKEKIDVS